MEELRAHCEIRLAEFPADLETVRDLFREYARLLDADLCFQGFAEELAGLPGAFAPPSGMLLLALVNGEAQGCVALRDSGKGSCEMKRLFVDPKARGLGLGRRLCEELLSGARTAGYRSMRLDTLDRLHEALRLYESLGFTTIPAYYPNPLPGVVYLARDL